MQISITVWVALCIGFLTALPKAKADYGTSLLSGQQLVGYDFATPDEQLGEEEPLDDSLGNEQSILQLGATKIIVGQQHLPARARKSSFNARAPPYRPL